MMFIFVKFKKCSFSPLHEELLCTGPSKHVVKTGLSVRRLMRSSMVSEFDTAEASSALSVGSYAAEKPWASPAMLGNTDSISVSQVPSSVGLITFFLQR